MVQELNEPQLRAPTPAELFEAMQQQESDTIDLVLQHKAEDGRTFSAAGIRQITEAFQIFLGARIAAHWKGQAEGHPGPSQVKATVTLEIDGEIWQVPPELRPWFVLDGESR